MNKTQEKDEQSDNELTWVKCDHCSTDVPEKKGYPNVCVSCLATQGACCSGEVG